MTGISRVVVVTGDITYDWYLARHIRAMGERSDPECLIRAYFDVGGAALLGQIIKVASAKDAMVRTAEPEGVQVPGQPPYWHSYAVCSQVPRERNHGELVWRVKDFLGLDREAPDNPSRPPQQLFASDDGQADLIVVADEQQGFQELRERIWPLSLAKPKPDAWALVKLTRPDFERSNLWKHLTDTFRGRMIVVVTIDDLRLVGLNISRAVSWERTASDTAREVRQQVRDLDACVQFVVSVSPEGAIVIGPQEREATLFCDAQYLEGDWQARYPGRMVGYSGCLVAGIAVCMTRSPRAHMDITPGVLSGLSASRTLHKTGFEVKTADAKPLPETLHFPTTAVAERIRQLTGANAVQGDNPEWRPFSKHPIPRETWQGDALSCASTADKWTILRTRYLGKQDLVFARARSIVRFGLAPDEWWDIPIGRFDKLLTVDRQEIEGLRAIRALFKQYIEFPGQQTPLSVAVFGAPGSGKSFTIEAVAQDLQLGNGVQPLTFNLSQFSDPGSIIDALQQVRDIALSEKVPLVFWDEFDTRLGEAQYGWLRYFLAPMQDGVFQEGPATHNIGSAIFVFAGGRNETMEQFRTDVTHEKNEQAKGNDFLSRLRGHVDISGVNYKSKDAREPGAVVRRAILLRAHLRESAGQITRDVMQGGRLREQLDVDEGVLQAFLAIEKFRHGARSIEAIVKMSMLAGRPMYDRSALPSEAQLSLHVNASEFLRIVRETPARARPSTAASAGAATRTSGS